MKKIIGFKAFFMKKSRILQKKHLVDVMMQDGTVKKQETFDVEKIHQV